MLLEDKSVTENTPPETIKVNRWGFFGTHTFPCPVCCINKANLYMNEMIFEPCDDCREKGWILYRENKLMRFVKYLIWDFMRLIR